MHKDKVPSGLRVNKTSAVAEDLKSQMILFARFLSIYLQNVVSWYSDRLQIRHNGGFFPGSSSIAWSLSSFGGSKLALDGEKTFVRSLYTLGIVGSSKDSSSVWSCIYITWKWVGIWVRDPRSNSSSMLSVTLELESRQWIVIRSKFGMRLWHWRQGRPNRRCISMLGEVGRSWASRCAPNLSVICNRSWKTEYVLRSIPPAYVTARAGKRCRRQGWCATSFWIRLRSLLVSTRACPSCPTRTTMSHFRRAGFRFFAWRWPEPESFTIATYSLAVLGLAPLRCLTLRDFFWHCASLWPFFSQ